MTEVKPPGARAAAERIYCQEAGVSHKELSGLRQLSDRPDIRIQEIEAIILEHCSDDKAGKLVEILRELLASIVEDWGISERYKIRRKAEAALAEYEAKK